MRNPFHHTLMSLPPENLKNNRSDMMLVSVRIVEYAAALPKFERMTSE